MPAELYQVLLSLSLSSLLLLLSSIFFFLSPLLSLSSFFPLSLSPAPLLPFSLSLVMSSHSAARASVWGGRDVGRAGLAAQAHRRALCLRLLLPPLRDHVLRER